MSHIKITFAIGKALDWLCLNFEDFAWSLDRNLRKRNEGKAVGEFENGSFIASVNGSSKEIVKPYVDAFERAMRRDGHRFIINSEEIASEEI